MKLKKDGHHLRMVKKGSTVISENSTRHTTQILSDHHRCWIHPSKNQEKDAIQMRLEERNRLGELRYRNLLTVDLRWQKTWISRLVDDDQSRHRSDNLFAFFLLPVLFFNTFPDGCEWPAIFQRRIDNNTKKNKRAKEKKKKSREASRFNRLAGLASILPSFSVGVARLFSRPSEREVQLGFQGSANKGKMANRAAG